MEKKHEQIIREKVLKHEHAPTLWNEKFVWDQITKDTETSKPSKAWLYAAASVVLALGLSIFGYTLLKNKQLELERASIELKIKELKFSKAPVYIQENSAAKASVAEICEEDNESAKIVSLKKIKKSEDVSPIISSNEILNTKEAVAEPQPITDSLTKPTELAETSPEYQKDTVKTIIGIIPNQKTAVAKQSRIRLKYTKPLIEKGTQEDDPHTIKIAEINK